MHAVAIVYNKNKSVNGERWMKSDQIKHLSYCLRFSYSIAHVLYGHIHSSRTIPIFGEENGERQSRWVIRREMEFYMKIIEWISFSVSVYFQQSSRSDLFIRTNRVLLEVYLDNSKYWWTFYTNIRRIVDWEHD